MIKCKVEGCGRLVFSSGYCSTHYNRMRLHGTTDDGPKARLPLSKRLYKYIRMAGLDDCWEWIGKSKVSGYGTIGIGGRGSGKALAHRVAWELVNGPIPKSTDYHGMVVMHTCDNRLCCNPRHLVLGRQSDNVRDMDSKGRRVSSPRHGEMHPNCKLTDSQVKEIRVSGKSNAELAKIYGCTRQNIRYIKIGTSRAKS